MSLRRGNKGEELRLQQVPRYSVAAMDSIVLQYTQESARAFRA